MWWRCCWRGMVRGEMWNMTQEGAAYDNEKQPEHGIGCKMWSMIYLLSSAALTTRRTGPGPLARVTIHLSVQPTPRPARPQHRGDKVIGNRESKEILREREREEYCCFIKSAQSYKWWRILLTTDNFLISLKKFYWKYSQNWSWLNCQNNHQISFYNMSSTFMTFQYILDIIISHELEWEKWKIWKNEYLSYQGPRACSWWWRPRGRCRPPSRRRRTGCRCPSRSCHHGWREQLDEASSWDHLKCIPMCQYRSWEVMVTD